MQCKLVRELKIEGGYEEKGKTKCVNKKNLLLWIFYSGTESIRASVCNATATATAAATTTTTARFLISS